MRRRDFVKSIALLGSAAVFNGAGCSPIALLNKRDRKNTNVLFIFTDDQRYDTIGALGNPYIHTPNIDRLAKRSFIFENAYCFGGNAGAVCIPARNMTMSGQTFFRFPNNGKSMRVDPAWPNLPKSMNAAGYQTWYQEKSGSANLPSVRKDFEIRKDVHAVNNLRKGRPAKPTIDDAIEFITETRDQSRPFCMYLGLAGPHDPRWAPQKYRDLYDPEKLPFPPNYKPVHPYDIGDMTIRDECLEVWPRTKAAIRKHIHDYYSLVSSMDYDIGRLLDTLKETGRLKDTLIVFSSDQGVALGSHGMMGKQNLYEDTLRVPLMFSGPGVSVGKSDALTYIHDIYPTLCEYVSTEIPSGLDGKSLLPIICGKEKVSREYLYLAYKDTQRAVRGQKWKLIRYPQINVSQLFDLESDPLETNDLSAKQEHKATLDKMFKVMESQQKHYGDTVPLTSADPKPAKFIHPTERLKTPFPAGGLAPEPWPEDQ
ncbi:MAG: sulfatase-like hydrolase/transferase [Phycisphaeraceae bacterium]|nr:sulfatase-like hydrolase/transferase [Phycisphaeraceae bacterium]